MGSADGGIDALASGDGVLGGDAGVASVGVGSEGVLDPAVGGGVGSVGPGVGEHPTNTAVHVAIVASGLTSSLRMAVNLPKTGGRRSGISRICG